MVWREAALLGLRLRNLHPQCGSALLTATSLQHHPFLRRFATNKERSDEPPKQQSDMPPTAAVPEPEVVQGGQGTERFTTETGTQEAETAASVDQAQTSNLLPKIIVFGGRGFVGSAVCKEALKTGLQVVSISRSGTPPPVREDWIHQVDWRRGSALEPQSYMTHLTGALAAVSCIGGFGSQQQMLKINGEANELVIKTARDEGVPRFVYISAFIPTVPGLEFALSGYVQGKRRAERVLFEEYPDTGVALRPSFIYGSRVISHNISLPLHLLFGPAQHVLNNYLPTKQLTQLPMVGGLFMPPVSVEAVAKAAVDAATDGSVQGGALDVWQIQRFAGT